MLSGAARARIEEVQAEIGLTARADDRAAILSHGQQEIFDLFPILRDFLRRRGGDLSGRQQQQLAIGRALASQPRLLILDEPTEGIQPNVIKDMARVIAYLARDRGMAVVLVEQYFEFARDLGDTLAIMVRGETELAGPTQSLDEDGVRKHLTV